MMSLTSPEEISAFLTEHDIHGSFKTRHNFPENFVNHFNQIISLKQILVFREQEKLSGFCSWVFTDEKHKKEINKTTWKLPDNITDGDILYIDACCLTNRSDMFKLTKRLKHLYRKHIKEVFWFNIPGGRVFKLKFKGGGSCQTAD